MPRNGKKNSTHSRNLLASSAILMVGTTAWAGVPSVGQIFDRLLHPTTNDFQRAYSRVAEELHLDASSTKGRHEKRSLGFYQRITGAGMATTKFQAYYEGIEVIGATAFYHEDSEGDLVRHTVSPFDASTAPVLDESQAVAIAKSVGGDLDISAKPELKLLPSDEGDSARLIYVSKLAGTADKEGSDVLIDADSGEVIAQISHHLTIAPIKVYETNSKCQEVDVTGAPVSLDVKSCDLTVSTLRTKRLASVAAKRAASNSKLVLDYYKKTQGRDSYDNRGSTVVSIVNVGKKFNNAFWDSEQNIMAYGEGDGVTFGDFTQGVDVAGHEMTHGVTSQTAKLLYMGESGALNEANSDFFGKMIANDGNWIMGKGLYVNQATAKGIRDLANPGSLTVKTKGANGAVITKPYPATYAERFPISSTCDGTNDHCWVHVNSTIPGHASYLVTQAIGREKAQKLYYTVLTQFLSARSTFKQAATSTVTACGRLFTAADCTKVKAAYTQVGLL